jgi:methylmalonyl-CoA/ethylmalonyl-CoA epimerase
VRGAGLGAAHSDETSLRADHVAIAVPQIDDALAFFERHFPIDMGWKKTLGYSRDFHWCDFYIGPFKIELIEPLGGDSFVSRFLAKRGPGLHHWSFETVRIEALLARMEADGLRIVDRFEMGDEGLTAFLSPRSAHGVLIQFWKVPEIKEPERPSSGSYRLRSGEVVQMRVDHVAIAVRDIEATLGLFERYFPFQLRRPPPSWMGRNVPGRQLLRERIQGRAHSKRSRQVRVRRTLYQRARRGAPSHRG